MIPSIQEPMHMMHYQSGNIQYGYQYSPVSPLYTTTSTTAAAAAATTTTPGTSNASNSKEFMNFTAHFVAQLCRETCLEELNVIPFDMMEYVDQVLSTTQVSLSIVVLALSIIKKVQRKVNAAIVGGGAGAGKTTSLASFGESMEDQRNQVLTRMASKMNVKTVFIVSLMIAMKSPNGCCNTFTNKTWSQVALIPSQILNALELDVALFLGFDLWDKEPEYLAWLNVVRNAAEQYSIKARMMLLAQRQKQVLVLQRLQLQQQQLQQQQQQRHFLPSPSGSPIAQTNPHLNVQIPNVSSFESTCGRPPVSHRFSKAIRVASQTPYQRKPDQKRTVTVLLPAIYSNVPPAIPQQQNFFQLPLPNGMF